MSFRDCHIVQILCKLLFSAELPSFSDKTKNLMINQGKNLYFHEKHVYFSQKTACYLLFYTNHRHNCITDAQANNYIHM